MKSSEQLPIKFTPEQLQAINHEKGPILVVAGAGTGKTAVITQRIARLILSGNAKAEEVLALTFTEKASSEMQQRVDELLPYGYIDTQIMTFHALAERIMREFALDAGVSPEFQVLSDFQQTIIFQEVLSSVEYSYFSPQYHPFAFIKAIKSSISRLKDEGISAKSFKLMIEKLTDDGELNKGEALADLAEIYSKYSMLCEVKNSLDFGDLLIKLQHLLDSKPEIKNELAKRYKYILVDEFQDTNIIQMEIISSILSTHNNIMAVGDDDQAIYSFRGATVKNILNFRTKYPDSELVVLKDNFRSGQNILDSGYRLIQNNNPRRLEVTENINKQLRGHNHPDATVRVHQYSNKMLEVEGVVNNIENLIKTSPEQNNIAILLRTNTQLKAYILGLQKKNIPYYVHQDVELFDQQKVKILVALTNTICDPNDSSSLFQLLISGFFKAPNKHEIIDLAAVARRQNKTLLEVLTESEDTPWAISVIDKITQWRELLSEYSAGEVLFIAVKSDGFLRDLIKDAEESVDSALGIQYMTDFFKLIKQFELASANPSLVELCSYLEEIKSSSADVMSDISPLDTQGVQVMTIHKAKGLEFDYVFMPELVEQSFPTYRKPEAVKFPDSILPKADGDHYDEERRLFYVGLTRARMGVEMSFATDGGGKRPRKPSRFIAESHGPNWQLGLIKVGAQIEMAELINSFEPINKVVNKDSMLGRFYKGDWLYLTTNQVHDYLRSPKEFWLFHVLQLPKGPFHTLVYGSSVHAALEHYYKFRLKSRKISIADVLDVYRLAWKSEGFVSADHEATLYETGRTAITNYIEHHKSDKLMPIAIEQPFELQLTDIKTVISGRYDIVLNTPSGLEIRDFKTSRVKDQKSADKKLKDSVQLGIYALSWEKLQQKPVSSVSLEFVEDLVVAKTDKIDHEKTIGLITQAVNGIKNMHFEDKGQSSIDFNKLLL